MTTNYYPEELRDKLSVLKHDAESLYRYGELSSSIDLFNELSPENQRVLLYLALTEGDKDVQNVAHRLMGPVPSSPEELLQQMSPYSRDQLEEDPKDIQSEQSAMVASDAERVANELREACNRIGSLAVEEAFWILLPFDARGKAIWIEAAGVAGHQVLDRLRFPSHVLYELTRDEKHTLIVSMQKAAWVLHVHNHPEVPGYVVYCAPSSDDIGFASQWKLVDPELASKMRFFVIKGERVVEYSLPEGGTRPWRVNEKIGAPFTAEDTETSAGLTHHEGFNLPRTSKGPQPLHPQPEYTSARTERLDISTILSIIGWLFLAAVILYGLLWGS